MNFKKALVTAAVGAASLVGVATQAQAGSEILPGITTGIALGAAPPQGVYVLQLPSYGYTNSTPGLNLGVVVPAWVIWSTPWDILGGHLVFDVATPLGNAAVHGVRSWSGASNPLIEAQLKWNLGGGWFGGVQAGAYLPVNNDLTLINAARDFASFQAVAAVSYLADGYNLTTTLIYGTGQDASYSSPVRNSLTAIPGSWGANWINLDLTATKKFGKVEAGAVGYASWDLDQPYVGYARQSQFVLGGLIGYDFGAANVAFKLTRTVAETNYGGFETRGWANIIIPLWVAPPPTTIAAKY